MAAYGSCLWSTRHADSFFCAWRKCVRRLLRVPRTTHCHLLPGVVEDHDPRDQLESRLVNFVKNSRASQNAIIKRCIQEVTRGSGSSLSDSWTDVCWRHRTPRTDDPPKPCRPVRSPEQVAVSEVRLREFILLREATKDSDLDFLVNYLATI